MILYTLLNAINEGADQTARMRRLVFAFVVRMQQICLFFLDSKPYKKTVKMANFNAKLSSLTALCNELLFQWLLGSFINHHTIERQI